MGYGADFYEPIARAISGINRQMDISATRAEGREARGMQRLLLTSQLQTQQDNRELSKRSAERSDRQLEESINANIHSMKMDKINQSRANVAQQQVTAIFNANKEKRAADQEKYKQLMTPAPINVYNQTGKNPRLQEILAGSADAIGNAYGPDAMFNPATGFIHSKSTGEKMMVSPFENLNKYSPSIQAIITSKTDPASVIRGDISQLTNEKIQLENHLKNIKTVPGGMDVMNKNKAELKVQIAKKDAQIQRRNNVSLDDLLKMYEERQDVLTQQTIHAVRSGASPELAATFTNALANNGKMIDRLYKQKAKETELTLKSMKADGKVDHRKKMLLTSIEKTRSIWANATKNIDLTSGALRSEAQLVRDRMEKQFALQSARWKQLGYNPVEIGQLPENIGGTDGSPPDTGRDATGDKEVSLAPKELPSDLPNPSEYENGTVIDDEDSGRAFKLVNNKWTEI